MNNVISLEQVRLVLVTLVSTLLSFYTPTKGFLLSLVLCFAFNIWCGMRADGVSIKRCRNFSMLKFHKALIELFLYIGIILVMFTCLSSMGDKATAIACIKIITYVFMYVYLQNSFKNLIQAYPDNMAVHIIYHTIRLELTRALPSNVQAIIDRYERNHNDNNNCNEDGNENKR